ncbi:MAG: CocE/NonD family hydrolase [Candidatus Thermoplasmatota archaeon]|nr:CocE/NonD family hydrolase [Candidatus Thermoplasmatota archaeon]
MINKKLKKEIVLVITILFIGTNIITIGNARLIEKTEKQVNYLTNIKKDSTLDYQPLFTKETYMVEMRDGIHLATDVYLPDNISSPHGAILIRTPYNKNGSGMGDWANKGWPSIVQDCRGRFQSEGIDTIFRDDANDGYDTLQWIAQQNWSNGKVATIGGSATGIVQYLMAGTNPPALKCQYIGAATPNLYTTIYQGGQFRKYMVEKWLEGQGSSYVLPELWAHENYTLDYWTNVSLEDNWQDVNVPAFHLGGWYDCFCQGLIDGFMGYQYNGGPGAAGKSKLMIGPWTHAFFGERLQGELLYPKNAKDVYSQEYWDDILNQYILGINNDFENRPNVVYYVMGDVKNSNAFGNFWRYADAWPPPCVEDKWYFHGDNTLSMELPGSNSPKTYTYNPLNPVPTKGGANLFPWPHPTLAGPYDQRSVENRPDVLIFTSDVLTQPYEATGRIKARLFVSSNCPDTDFTVKLTDVYPDGRSMLICDGILRMRNRNGFDHWEFITPGQIYEIEVDLWSTSYIWDKGHRIRVDVSSSNYPRFLVNPNTMDGIYQNSSYNIAQNTLYLDSAHPSCIILPRYNGNYAPLKPVIKGPAIGSPGVEYTFSFNSTDPENEDVQLYIDWGDGTNTGWIGPYNSGEEITLNHVWNIKNKYTIKARAKDINGDQSEWSYHTFDLPRNRLINNMIFQKILSFLSYLFSKNLKIFLTSFI